MPDVLIVGDPKADPTGVMYERSFAERGFASRWLSATEFLNGYVPNGERVGFYVSDEYPDRAHVFFEKFAEYGMVTTNSAQSVKLASDKSKAYEVMSLQDIPTPRTIFLNGPVNSSLEELGLPIVVKPVDGSRGDGVTLIDTMPVELSVGERSVIAQHYVECGSSDKRLIFVDGEFIVAMERRAAPNDFRSNLAKGGTAHACEVSEEEIELGRRIIDAMQLRFAGLDIGTVRHVLPGREYLEIGKPFCLEANAMPALDGPVMVGGIDASVNVVDMLISDLKKLVAN